MSELLPVVNESGAASLQPAAGSVPPMGPPPAYAWPAQRGTGTILASGAKVEPVPNWVQRWDSDEFEVGSPGVLRVGGALLKAQGQVARDLHSGHGVWRYLAGCLALMGFATCAYGAIIGSFAGVEQALMAALKLPLVVLGSAAICLPSFYVFQCLMGARLSLRQAAQSIALLAAAASLILLACAPIVWFFSMSTEMDSPAFVALLHMAVAAAGSFFGMRLLWRMRAYLELRMPGERLFDGRVLALWLALFLVVTAQMACFMGPLMSQGEFFTGERGLFVGALIKLLSG